MKSAIINRNYSALMLGLLVLAMFASPKANATELTLAEALRLSAENSPALASAAAQDRSAEAALDSARAYPNPELEIASGMTRPRQPGGENGRIEMLGLSQQFELPGLRNARRQGAEAGIVSGSANLAEARLYQYITVKQAFYDVLRRQEESGLAAENFALLQQIRNRVKVKVGVGESPRYELVKSEAETLAAESAARSAEHRITQARDRLRAVTGGMLAATFVAVAEPAQIADLPALNVLREELLARQPLLKVAESETHRAQARLDLERALRTPQPTIKLSSERDQNESQWRIGVVMPLPLWSRRAGPIGEARAGMERAQADAQQIRLELLAELDQAYSRYQIAGFQVATFESGLLKEAESALKVAEAAYRYGERGILDYLDAQRVLRSTRMDFLNARYELQAALIVIERLRATPLTSK
jgi:cobalt-zinc-cadmium efflux system outer membrane protein